MFRLFTATERTSAMGTIIKVRVSLTIVASPSAVGLHEAAAATTDEVSFMAVPAHIPKPTSFMPSRCPSAGKMKTAIMLKRKIVEIACVMSESSASIIGAVEAIAEAPQIDVPTPMSVVVLPLSFNALPTKYAVRNAVDSVNIMTKSYWLPTWNTRKRFMPKPSNMIANCSTFLEVNLMPPPNLLEAFG